MAGLNNMQVHDLAAPTQTEAVNAAIRAEQNRQDFIGSAFVMALALSATLLAGCAATLPPRGEAIVSSALTNVEGTWLHQLTTEAGSSDKDGFKLVSEPFEALRTRLALIAASQKTLDLQYFIWASDETGRLLLQEVLKAADRGVRVRLLLDDLHAGEADNLLQAVDSHPDIEVRLFNPFAGHRGGAFSKLLGSLSDFKRVRHRMHNKLLVADNVFALTGGRNVGDLYLTRRQGRFLDVDLLASGPIVRDLSDAFDDYWNSDQAYEGARLWPSDGADVLIARLNALREERLQVLPPEQGTPRSPNEIVGSKLATAPQCTGRAFTDPVEKAVGTSLDDSSLTVHQRLIQLFAGSQEDVFISSPYFVRGLIGLQRISTLRQKGVTVRVLTNSLATTDEPLAHVVYLRYRVALLEAGLELHELAPPREELTRLGAIHADRLHAKLAVVDHRHLYVGSMNFTSRSEHINTEVGLILDCPPIADQVLRLMERAQSYSVVLARTPLGIQWVRKIRDEEEVWQDEPHVSLWRKLKNLLASPFIPEGEI